MNDPLDTTIELTAEIKLRSAKQALQTIALVHWLDGLFPAPEASLQNECTDATAEELAAAVEDVRRDRAFFLALVKSMLPRFESGWIPNPHQLRQRFASELAWYDEIVNADCEKAPVETKSSSPESLWALHEEIQGNILTEYKNITHGCLLLLRLAATKSARTFLQFLQSQVTTGVNTEGDTTLNVAFTYNGLKTLGLSDAELVKFPKEFREGMEARASVLGDIGPNHPSQWKFPYSNWPLGACTGGSVRLSTVDLVIQLQKANVGAPDDKWFWCAEHPLYQKVKYLAEHVEQEGGQLLAVQPLRRKLIDGNVYEHFGFRNGISQFKLSADHRDGNQVTLGELLLGHVNDHGDPVEETRDPILHNGTFLVVRKLAQDVTAFEQFLDSHGNEIDRETLAAKMVGRTSNGTPIVNENSTSFDVDNNFDYEDDPDGLKCPFHAHIRRANPRDEREKQGPVPHIMRRGFTYGPRFKEDPESDRGLMFMAYNASIAQQFEVIQRWISGGNSSGVLSTNSDPLLGVSAQGHERKMSFIHNGKVLRFNLGGKPFVKLEWGMYLFVPSISALQKLSENDASATPYPQANLQRGTEFLQKYAMLDSIESPSDAVLRWKKLLEDRSSRRYAEDVWAAIRARGGASRTPYGVLVANETEVMRVLRDEGEFFSVREFPPRMNQTTGVHYLGLDAKPKAIEGDSQAVSQRLNQHADDYVSAMKPVGPNKVSRYQYESKSINPWIANFCPKSAFADAREQSRMWLDKILIGDDFRHGEIKLRDLVRDVFGQLAVQWFGLPNDGSVKIGGVPATRPHCPEDFQMVSSYVFYPNPTPYVEAKARERGRAMRAEIERYVTNAIAEDALPANTLLSNLHADGAAVSTIVRTIAGVAAGFISPTTSSLLSVMNTWIVSEDFWRHQQAFLRQPKTGNDAYAHASKVLKSVLIRAMQERPAPLLLQRTVVKNDKLGNVFVKPGERVVLGLVSATLQQLEKPVANDKDATRVLFGGNYGEQCNQATAHACPGQSMAFGVMLGIISTLFELNGTLRPRAGLVLRLNEY